MEKDMMWKPQFSKLLSAVALAILLLPALGTGHYENPPVGNYLQENSNSLQYEVRDNILWYPVERLTWMGNSTHPVLGRDGQGNYHIVWQDDRNGNWDIYYLKVDTEGFKLLNDTRITTYSGDDINPDIVTDNDTVYIVWQREINGTWSIYFSRISYTQEDIQIEVPPKPLAKDGDNCTEPKLAMDNRGYLHLVWQEYRNGNWDIMYQLFNRKGEPLISPVDVSQDESNSTRPAIVVDDENSASIFWIDERKIPGYSLLYRKVSSGKFLTEVKKLSVVSPQTTVDAFYYNNSIYTTFSCSREMLAYEIIFTKLTDNGDTVIDDKNLTPLDAVDSILPRVYVRDSSIFLLWNDVPSGVVRFSVFDLNGRRRGEILNLTPGQSFNPSMDMNERSIGMVWESVDLGKRYLYFRSGELPNLQVKSLEIKSRQRNVTANFIFHSTMPLWSNYTLSVDGSVVKCGEIFLNNTVSMTLNFTLTPGEHVVEVRIDPANTIVEYREDDNSLSQNIFIKYLSFALVTPENVALKSGETQNFTISVINQGNWVDNYTLHIEFNSTLFTVKYPFAIENVTPGEIREVNISIYAHPYVLSSKYMLRLNLSSVGTGEWKTAETNVSILPEGAYEIGYSSIIHGTPEEWVPVQISIRNTGNCRDTYFIYFNESIPWPFKYASEENISLNPGEMYTYSVEIYIPATAAAYEKNMVNFTVSSTMNITRYAETVILVAPVYKAKAEIVSMEENQSHCKIKINVVNTGNIATLFNLNLSGEAAPFALMSSPHLFLNPGENTTVEINVYLPASLLAGSYNLYLHVLSNKTTLVTIPIKIGVPERHSLAFQLTKVEEGKRVRFELRIKNSGNAPDVVQVKVSLSGVNNTTWLIIYRDKNYTNETSVYLKPNETVMLSIIPITNLKEGNYKILITTVSASGIKKELTASFFVGVKKESFWETLTSVLMANIIYIGIAVGAVAAALLYKFKLKK